MDKKTMLGLISLCSGAGYLYLQLNNNKAQKLNGELGSVKFNPHKAVDMAMGFVNMNPIAKAIISEGLKRTMPPESNGEVIDAKAKRIK